MKYDLIIIGGGITGLCTALWATQKNLNVLVLDKSKAGRGASWAAAGMLAPNIEAEHDEADLLNLSQEAIHHFDLLQNLVGDFEMNKNGSLEIALVNDDVKILKREFDYRRNNNIQVEWIVGSKIHELEPLLNNSIPAAIFSPMDWQIDHRILIEKIKNKIIQNGSNIIENQYCIEIFEENNEIRINTETDTFFAKKAIITTGFIPNQKLKQPFEIIPVKGQMLAFEPDSTNLMTRVIRIRNKFLGFGYIVPKKDRIIVGSTSEEMGEDSNLTAGGILSILRKAYHAIPAIQDWNLIDQWVGHRPATPSRHPVLHCSSSNLFYYNGLFRNGIYFSPFLSKSVINFIYENELDWRLKPFLVK